MRISFARHLLLATALVFASAPTLAATFVQTDGTKATTSTEVVTNKKLAPMLRADSAKAARAAVEKYAEIVANGGWPKVPRGTYSRNKKSDNTTILNRRLSIEGYLSADAASGDQANVFSVLTEQAVARYQRNMGLAVTGKVDGATLTQLNVPAGSRLATLEANVARLEIYSANLGDRYLIVNVPSQHIEAVSGGRIYSRHNAIVGRPERPTPVVMTPLSMVRFNPYWHAPVSIVENDIIPKIRNGTRLLEDMNMKVFKGYGGEEIDPSDVDWSSAVPDDYLFRQEPGPSNAMATAKIEFSSPFGIYLHDTPEKNLFKSGRRFYSSGCVRVENMPLLVNWVLNSQDGYGPDQISAMAETLERKDVELAGAAQLRVAYLTAWPLPDGTVAFRDDIYQLDQTGFTVGQPLPPGELSDEGLRYVLKPIPRQLAQVDAAEAEGIGIFGNRKTTRVAPFIPGRTKPLASEDKAGDDDVSNVGIFGKKKPGLAPTIIKSNQPVVAEKKKPFFTADDKPASDVKTGKKFTLFGAASKSAKTADDKPSKPLFKSNFASAKKGRGKPFSFFNSKKVAKAEPETSGPSNIVNLAPATTARKTKFKKTKVIAQKPAALQCTILNGVAQPGCKGVKKVKTVKLKTKLRAKPAAASLR
jgi:peptidoglycan hydrolase-like protein with peptidoglycan-binding domain